MQMLLYFVTLCIIVVDIRTFCECACALSPEAHQVKSTQNENMLMQKLLASVWLTQSRLRHTAGE